MSVLEIQDNDYSVKAEFFPANIVIPVRNSLIIFSGTPYLYLIITFQLATFSVSDNDKNKMGNTASMEALFSESFLFASNASFVENIYHQYLDQPNSVSEHWQTVFKGLNGSTRAEKEFDHREIAEKFKGISLSRAESVAINDPVAVAHEAKQVAVLQHINAYRFSGHIKADINPLHLDVPDVPSELDLSFRDFTEQDLDQEFNTGSLAGPERATLRQIVKILENTYCGSIGSEYMYLSDTQKKRWIQDFLEGSQSDPNYSIEIKRRILDRVVSAEGLESYLHRKYVGQKRFSLEGGLSLIPLFDSLIQSSGKAGVKEIVFGMAHRGRLNVLVNILGKCPGKLFKEFEGHVDNFTDEVSGDVKYHQGFSSDISTAGGIVHLAMAFNPSHLEIVNPVVEGSARARQNQRGDKTGQEVLPVLIHGDAAFAGQGVVMETLNMSQTRGYGTGGTIHIIINNQIGFTTSHPHDTRSTYYCTEVARMIQAPILHVNGDDPEAVTYATEFAVAYRMKFRSDVVIDMVCYRRYGHSEADEPTVTQPIMYKTIRPHPLLGEVYSRRLIAEGVITADEYAQLVNDYHDKLDREDVVALDITKPKEKSIRSDWSRYDASENHVQCVTSVSEKTIKNLAIKLNELPKGFVVHKRVEKILHDRELMGKGEKPGDWGFCEILAYATLINEGITVRLSGQDSGRGTFFHRHARLHDQITGESFIPLKNLDKKNLDKKKTKVEMIDSFLSEEAVLGFEYGYATAEPNGLTIWEAQFGDFANGAQVVIDQFIAAGETKWGRLCNLVLLLPHGYDGQGPEHSSARVERYLQLCAHNNMRVCVPTMPAQIFHLLRAQVICVTRKPLIVMSPKSLLRHPEAVSEMSDLTDAVFQLVIEDKVSQPSAVKKLILCSGKIYFNLKKAWNELPVKKRNSYSMVRVEQLYPFPSAEITEILAGFKSLQQIIWVQDEPRNQGGWRYIRPKLEKHCNRSVAIIYVGRPESASPAVGYLKVHLQQEELLIQSAFK